MTVRVCADDLKTLKQKGLVQRWKDLPEKQKPEKVEVESSKKLDLTPKKATPKAKKEAAAKKKVSA